MNRCPVSSRRVIGVAGCLIGLMANGSPVYAQGNVTRQLIDQGNYWHERSRDDLAADTWNKLLRIDPTQPDALLGLAQIDLAQGNTGSARARLQILMQAHPTAPQTAQLRNVLSSGGGGDALQSARQAAAAGNYPEAVRQYRTLFGNEGPSSQLALEYYQVLAGTPQGWDEAAAGLARLAAANAGDATTALAYAQVLTYRENSRREGIHRLVTLAGSPDVGAPARVAWRQALIWLNASSSDAGLYRDYLAQSPDDEAIKNRLATLASAEAQQRASDNPAQRAITAGYKALQANQLVSAENQFIQAIKARPGDGDALGGLGAVRLKQQRFPEAKELLTRASRSDAKKWRTALDSARYWTALQQAQAVHAKGDDAQARQLLLEAVKLQPREPQGYAALGDALLAGGDQASAERAYQQALSLQAGYPAALRGLVDLYTRENRPDQALALMNQATPTQRQAMGGDEAIRASQHRTRAQLDVQQGNPEAAQHELESGLVDTPADPWIRLDLARMYQHQGRIDQARSVMNGLLLAHPDSSQALFANALFASESSDWGATLASLERIPPAQRMPDMVALQQRAWLQQQALAAARLARQGRPADAQQLLMQAESSLGSALAARPELLSTLAGAYADAGNAQRAVQLAQTLLGGNGGDGVGNRLLYASVLLKTHQDAELAATLRLLQTQPMSADQQLQFDQLRLAYTLRQVDALREMGNLEAAYSAMAPLLAAQPNDPQIVSALARLYSAAGDQAQALKLYRQILQQKPNDLDALLAAANTAAAMHDLRTAEDYMQQALSQAPDSPDVLASAGRMYRVAGKNSRAEDYFRAALEAQARLAGNPSNGLPVVSNSVGVAPSNQPFNPFAGMTGGASPSSAAASLPAPTAMPVAAVQPTMPPASSADGAPWTPPGGATMAAGSNGDIPPPVNAGTASIPLPAPASAGTTYPVPGTETAAASPAAATASPTLLPRVPRTMASSGDPILDELRDLQASNSSSLSTGVVYRTRDGEKGLGKLDDIEVPFQAQLAVGDGKLSLSATPTLLDSGTAGNDYGTASRFGSGPSAALAGALASHSDAIATLTGSDLYQGLLTEGDNQATRNLIYNSALSSGEYQTLYNATDATLTAAERQTATLAALYAEPLPQYMLSNNLSATPISQIAKQILGNSSLSRGLTSAQLATLTSLSSSSAATQTPAEFENQLYTLAASSAGSKHLSNQDATGMGLSIGYQVGGLRADVGTTPLGFRQSQFVGGLGYHGSIGDELSFDASLSRRAVSDSLLSFAGARDPRTGLSWGGVTANGARLGMTWDDGLLGVYGNLGYQRLTGEHVADNNRQEAGAGVYVHAIQTSEQSLTAGLNVTGLRYDKNLGGFTYGQGGYFSPQRYVEVGFPVHWNGHTNALSWKVDASVGVQSFKENASNYFPTDAAMQQDAYDAASIAALLGLSSQYVAPVYLAQSKTGISYNLAGTVEWQLAPQLYLGGRTEFNNARNYQQFSTGLYLRFLLDRYGGGIPTQPAPLTSPYSQNN